MEGCKINVFVDTNSLECRFKKFLFLDDFYVKDEIKELMNSLESNDTIRFLIPEVVWSEMIYHLIESYKDKWKSFNDILKDYEKAFGNLLEFNYVMNSTDYMEYINTKAQNWIKDNSNKVSIVNHKIDEEKFRQIISNAMRKKNLLQKQKELQVKNIVMQDSKIC